MASGVDTSEWDCPCDIDDLEEWVTEENWECDVCSNEYPTGKTFYGNRSAEWDVCEGCYTGKDPDDEDEADGLSAQEVQQRLANLYLLEQERRAQKEEKKMNAVHRGYMTVAKTDDKRDPLHSKLFSVNERVAARLLVLGKPDKNESYGRVAKINEDGTVDIKFDMGRVQKGMHPDDVGRVGLAEEFVVDIQDPEDLPDGEWGRDSGTLMKVAKHLDPHFALHAAKPGAHSVGYTKEKHEGRIELNTSFRTKVPKPDSECGLIGIFKKKPSDWIDSDIGNSFGVVLNPRMDANGSFPDVFARAKMREMDQGDKCHLGRN